MAGPSSHVDVEKVSQTGTEPTRRTVPEETPVALVYDGATYAVMMATPQDLEDFGLGFSLTEGIVRTPEEILSQEVVKQAQGLEVRMWLAPGLGGALSQRRRAIAGPTGCGLCGVESLEAAVPEPAPVPHTVTITPLDVYEALAVLAPAQVLNLETHAVHAAAFWDLRRKALGAVREDVGRHNALDKLGGAMAAGGMDAGQGLLLLTSRVSVEMVQKAAQLGFQVLIAVSAPTTLALRVASAAGMTVIAVAREDAFEVFTHPSRLLPSAHDSSFPSEVRLHEAV
jgi:FdhD protein